MGTLDRGGSRALRQLAAVPLGSAGKQEPLLSLKVGREMTRILVAATLLTI